MRFFSRLFALLIPVCALLCGAAGYFLCALPVFSGGEGYEFYLGDSSSAEILLSSDPVLDKLTHPAARGECVHYRGDRYEELKAAFCAELVFTEEADGVISYYLRSPRLGACIRLKEGDVNLHIAVRGDETAAGTPIIFGGF